jgi:hypothetical protein
MILGWRQDSQHNDTEHKWLICDTQQNDTQHNKNSA